MYEKEQHDKIDAQILAFFQLGGRRPGRPRKDERKDNVGGRLPCQPANLSIVKESFLTLVMLKPSIHGVICKLADYIFINFKTS